MTYQPPLTDNDPHGGPPRRRRSRINWPVTLAVLVLAVLMTVFLLRPGTVSDRERDDKIVRVVLPPPPPPPPPEVQPEETPPEPTPTPMEQPVETAPPPPDAPAEPTAGDNALTAREGAGPSNYGLAAGDGSGRVIGGRPGGGDGFGAYTSVAQDCIQRVARADRELTRDRYRAELVVTMAADGRIANVRVTGGADDRRSTRIREVLTGLQCQTPPAGLPVMRIEISNR